MCGGGNRFRSAICHRFNRIRLKHLLFCVVCLFLLDFFGVFTHLFESDYSNFNYPLEGDVIKWAHQLKSGQKPDVLPINVQNFTFVYSSRDKCLSDDSTTPLQPRIVFIVKSARANFAQRNAIRHSWGFEKRFSDVVIRTVFLLGTGNTGYDPNDELQKSIDIEVDNFGDIVLGNFVDSYFNNTIKTVMGWRWAIENCPNSKFYMFADDDFYVSTKNVLRFIRNPINYPEYLEEEDETLKKLARKLSNTNGNSLNNSNLDQDDMKRLKRHLINMELPSHVKLFAGFVIKSAPHRHKSSKWHVSLKEYPWHMWPPYVTAGSYILSQAALQELYYVSMFTKHFRFDDIFMSIVALKAKIEPLHSEEFHFHKAPYSGPSSYRYIVASHGYENPTDMIKVWSECRAAGHA